MSRPCHHFHQLDAMDCGPTCLQMIAKHYAGTIRWKPSAKSASSDAEDSVKLREARLWFSDTNRKVPLIAQWQLIRNSSRKIETSKTVNSNKQHNPLIIN